MSRIMKPKNMTRYLLPSLLALTILAGCVGGRSRNGTVSPDDERASELARFEHHVALIDSLIYADHSVRAYLSRAWICYWQDEDSRALRYTDTVMALVTDAVPLATVNNARYLRSLCFDRMGQTEKSVEEMKAVIASEDPGDPESTHEPRLNLAYYYFRLKRYGEALEALPDSTSAGGRQLWRLIHDAEEKESAPPRQDRLKKEQE